MSEGQLWTNPPMNNISSRLLHEQIAPGEVYILNGKLGKCLLLSGAHSSNMKLIGSAILDRTGVLTIFKVR